MGKSTIPSTDYLDHFIKLVFTYRLDSIKMTSKNIRLFITGLITFGTMSVLGQMSIQYAFAEPCDNVWEIGFDCDISGWITFVIGDIVLGIALSMLFLVIAHTLTKQTETMQLIKLVLSKTQSIVVEQEERRNRLKRYARQAFKNDCGALLLCFGILNKLSQSGNDDWIKNPEVDRMLVKSKKILVKIHNTINLSVGTIDPVLLEEIETFITYTDDVLYDISKISAQYDEIKKKIMYLTERLNNEQD